jgi:hypothetical protein
MTGLGQNAKSLSTIACQLSPAADKPVPIGARHTSSAASNAAGRGSAKPMRMVAIMAAPRAHPCGARRSLPPPVGMRGGGDG